MNESEDRKQEVLKALSIIIDPDLNQDIVSLGFIKELSIKHTHVSFSIALTTPACPIKKEFYDKARHCVQQIPWVSQVSIKESNQNYQSNQFEKKENNALKKVGTVIAVSSCKGGVGKSTIAVNLACSLAKQNANVGIFDADIYGPSLPTLCQVNDTNLVMNTSSSLIQPILFENLKLMSFAYTQDSDHQMPAIMRGPMVSQIIQQLLFQTEWGELDYLIIDMPPGTGDIQLTLGQIIPITASVIVTTPQKISYLDVVKGIDMFEKLNIPIVAIVQNMSMFTCQHCQHKQSIFGNGQIHRFEKEYGFEHTFLIPLDPILSSMSDKGEPITLNLPEHSISQLFNKLSHSVIMECSKIQNGKQKIAKLSYNKSSGIQILLNDITLKFSPLNLRLRCLCAHCQDEFTGKRHIDQSSIENDIYPLSLNSVGNYALGIEWSDNHSSLFPYKILTEWADVNHSSSKK